jgi:hypothetical protein
LTASQRGKVSLNECDSATMTGKGESCPGLV